jgi:hypothetical protein
MIPLANRAARVIGRLVSATADERNRDADGGGAEVIALLR